MNLDLMACHRFTSGLVFPPMNFQRSDLTRLYAEISERYEYNNFMFIPDGARLAQGDDELYIQQSRIQINEGIPVHFNMTKEKALDLFRSITDRLGVRQYLAFGIKQIAFQPMDNAASAAAFIENNLIQIDPQRFERLGPGRQGTGLRFNFQRDESAWDLKIEPFYKNPTHLYIDLDVQFARPFNDLSGLEGVMDGVYGYLFREVREFLSTVE
jgi:hypothetical protein